ncbi:MAG TPA: hypothetical protein VFX84_02015 [Candidatus Saccharimonadales bacterium]|nr:hypothetical protein [Candidatus Saccharimonadales bacterium]
MSELATSPDGGQERELSLAGMPTLARGRMPEEFPLGERFVYLFDPKWRDEEPELVTGTIADASATDRPFRMGLPLGSMYDVLGQEARLLRGEDFITLESLKPSELPDLPRQIMLNSPELRSRIPSAGFVTLETPAASVPRIIGIEMNDNSLIPESAMPLLQRDADFRTVWLLDGPDDLERRTALERAIHDWSPAEGAVAAGEAADSGPRRARRHARNLSHKVLRHPDTSTDTFSADRI